VTLCLKLQSILVAARDTDKLIELARTARKNCEYSVGLSNLLGETATWCAEHGRPAEAMEFGQLAARSYSGSGLLGLANALAVNGKPGEARKIFAAASVRYDTCIIEQVRFLQRIGAGAEETVAAIAASRRAHPHSTLIDNACASVACTSKDKKLRKLMLAGPLAGMSEVQRDMCLGNMAMAGRDFEEAIRIFKDHGRFRAHGAEFHVLLVLHAAFTLTGNREEMTVCSYKLDILGKRPGRHQSYFAARRLPRDEVFGPGTSENVKLILRWQFGIEAEARGDTVAAEKHYREAVYYGEHDFVNGFCRRWLQALGKKRK